MLFNALSSAGFSIENPREFVKDEYVYRGLPSPRGLEQLNSFNGQVMAEYRLLNHVDLIVSDSPVAMNVCYALTNNFEGWDHLLGLSRIYDRQFKPLNILLDATGIKYKTCGRYETEVQASEMHDRIIQFLGNHVQDYVTMRTVEVADRIGEIISLLKQE